MVTTNFEDFYEVPNLNFDISRLRNDLDKILKGEKLTRPLNGTSVSKNQKRPRRRYQRKRNTKNGSNHNSSNGKKPLHKKDVNPKTPTSRKKLGAKP